MEEIYTYTQEAWNVYTFMSTGRKEVKKVVTFDEIAYVGPDIYNVLLQDEVDGVLSDDITITNNGDPLKVINTIVAIIQDVLRKNPHWAIHLAGSTDQRNKAYQRRTMKELHNKEFILVGQKEIDGDFDVITKGENYIAFLVFPA